MAFKRGLISIVAFVSMTSLAQFTDARGYPGQLQEYLKKDNLYLMADAVKSGTKLSSCMEMNLVSILAQCLVMPIKLRETMPMGGKNWARDGELINLCPNNIKSSFFRAPYHAKVQVTEFKVPRICHVPKERDPNWVTYYATSASCVGMDCDMSNLAFWDEEGNFIPYGYVDRIGGGRQSDEVDLLGDMVREHGIQLRTTIRE